MQDYRATTKVYCAEIPPEELKLNEKKNKTKNTIIENRFFANFPALFFRQP